MSGDSPQLPGSLSDFNLGRRESHLYLEVDAQRKVETLSSQRRELGPTDFAIKKLREKKFWRRTTTLHSVYSPGAIERMSGSKGKAVSLHRCRFPDWSPAQISSLAISPASFDTASLNLGEHSAERSILAVGRSNGDVELYAWGGHQGWAVFNVSSC